MLREQEIAGGGSLNIRQPAYVKGDSKVVSMTSRLMAYNNSLLQDLVNYITQKDYQSGDRLPSERELAEIFHTNRNTLREALNVLRIMEIIEIKRGSGIYLTGSVPADVDSLGKDLIVKNKSNVNEINIAKNILEIAVIDFINADDFDKIADELQRCMDRIDVNNCTAMEYLEMDVAFHRTVFTVAGNSVILKIWEDLTASIYDERIATFRTSLRRTSTFSEHSAIIAAYRTRNRDFVRSVIKAHFASVNFSVQNLE